MKRDHKTKYKILFEPFPRKKKQAPVPFWTSVLAPLTFHSCLFLGFCVLSSTFVIYAIFNQTTRHNNHTHQYLAKTERALTIISEQVCNSTSNLASGKGGNLTLGTVLSRLASCDFWQEKQIQHTLNNNSNTGSNNNSTVTNTTLAFHNTTTIANMTRLAIIQVGQFNNWMPSHTLTHLINHTTTTAFDWHIDLFVRLTTTSKQSIQSRIALKEAFSSQVTNSGATLAFFEIVDHNIQQPGLIALMPWSQLHNRFSLSTSSKQTTLNQHALSQLQFFWEVWDVFLGHVVPREYNNNNNNNNNNAPYNWVLVLHENTGWILPPALPLADPHTVHINPIPQQQQKQQQQQQNHLTFLLPGKYALTFLHSLAFGVATLPFAAVFANMTEMLQVISKTKSIPIKRERGKVNEQGEWLEFGLCAMPLSSSKQNNNSKDTDVCFLVSTQTEFVSTLPEGLNGFSRLTIPHQDLCVSCAWSTTATITLQATITNTILIVGLFTMFVV